jgi:RES domain-containing protein
LTTAYRISKKAFAATLWSGIGTREFGGRWNSKGIAVVYTSESRALAAMEQLVHLVKPRILRGYVVASITFHDVDVQRVDPRVLPSDWDNPVASPALKAFGDDWATAL